MELTKQEKKCRRLSLIYVIMVYIVVLICVIMPAKLSGVLEQIPIPVAYAVCAFLFFAPGILGLANLLYIKKNYENISRETFLLCAVHAKCFLLPLFVAGGFAVAGALFSFFEQPPVPAAVMILFLYEVVLGGAVFSVPYIIKANKEGICNTFVIPTNTGKVTIVDHNDAIYIVAAVMQFFFTFDGLSIMAFSVYERKHFGIWAVVLLLVVVEIFVVMALMVKKICGI